MLVNVYFDQLFQLINEIVVEDYYHIQILRIFVFYLLLIKNFIFK
jgi:hypothetical protein